MVEQWLSDGLTIVERLLGAEMNYDAQQSSAKMIVRGC